MEYSIKTELRVTNTAVKLETFEKLGIQDFKNHPIHTSVFFENTQMSMYRAEGLETSKKIKFTNLNNQKLVKLYKQNDYLCESISINIQKYSDQFFIADEKVTLRLSLDDLTNEIIKAAIKDMDNKTAVSENKIKEYKERIKNRLDRITDLENAIKENVPCECECTSCYNNDYDNCTCDDRCEFDQGEQCHTDSIKRAEKVIKEAKESIVKLEDHKKELEEKTVLIKAMLLTTTS